MSMKVIICEIFTLQILLFYPKEIFFQRLRNKFKKTKKFQICNFLTSYIRIQFPKISKIR